MQRKELSAHLVLAPKHLQENFLFSWYWQYPASKALRTFRGGRAGSGLAAQQCIFQLCPFAELPKEMGTCRHWLCTVERAESSESLTQGNCRDKLVWSCTAWQQFAEEHRLLVGAERHHSALYQTTWNCQNSHRVGGSARLCCVLQLHLPFYTVESFTWEML